MATRVPPPVCRVASLPPTMAGTTTLTLTPSPLHTQGGFSSRQDSFFLHTQGGFSSQQDSPLSTHTERPLFSPLCLSDTQGSLSSHRCASLTHREAIPGMYTTVHTGRLYPACTPRYTQGGYTRHIPPLHTGRLYPGIYTRFHTREAIRAYNHWLHTREAIPGHIPPYVHHLGYTGHIPPYVHHLGWERRV